jgi:hypothetical protein
MFSVVGATVDVAPPLELLHKNFANLFLAQMIARLRTATVFRSFTAK